ncbi:MAG: sigma-70 family RNA polymerase sigma factor [Planctomycetaceae bacterium]|nr:sigma-70 family RNA polymerase sigma factor [Planctomycetaceae bacterium]
MHQTNQVRSWTGFLVRLATLRSVDRIRSNRKEKQMSDSDHFSNQGPQEEAVGRELAAWLRRATASLPEQQAAVFSLAHYEQLDRNEIAAVLSIPPESVSTALYKARQNLQSQLNVLDGGSK